MNIFYAVPRPRITGPLLKVLIIVLLLGNPLTAMAQTDAQLSQELATILRAARKVISTHQEHINNPQVGHKGLSADVVLENTYSNFNSAVGYRLNPEGEAKTALLAAIRQVIDSNQTLINTKGIGFKGFLPAIFAGQVVGAFNHAMKGKIRLKLTAPLNYIRNPLNRPDRWEQTIIENRFRQPNYIKGKPYYEHVDGADKSKFRFILPEYYSQSCLGCHGHPKGELDITGGRKEGGVLGELGGAISVVIYQ